MHLLTMYLEFYLKTLIFLLVSYIILFDIKFQTCNEMEFYRGNMIRTNAIQML